MHTMPHEFIIRIYEVMNNVDHAQLHVAVSTALGAVFER